MGTRNPFESLRNAIASILVVAAMPTLVDCALPDFAKVTPECSASIECVEKALDEPAVCRAGHCVPLKTRECPVVLNEAGLRDRDKPDAIVIGAYSFVDPLNPKDSPITLAYGQAIEEFAGQGNLPGGSGAPARPLVAVVCDGQNGVTASAEHLIDDVGVPAVVSALYEKDLKAVFEQKGRQKKVFFLSPFEADDALRLLPDDGLLWHMLSGPEAIAKPYAPLLARVEAFAKLSGLRVAMVDSRVSFLQDIAEELLNSSDPAVKLAFNGKPALENGTSFRRFTIDSALDNPGADLSATIKELLDLKPHVIVSLTGSEFLDKMMPQLETLDPPPYYLLSPYHAGAPALISTVGSSPKALSKRVVGVNFAGAVDPTLYNAYLSRISATHTTVSFAGTENFYDAIYFVALATAAGSNGGKVDGAGIATGMKRLLGGTPFGVGPSDIPEAIDALSRGSIQLNGTLGPPDFDTNTGARRIPGSVYCVDASGFAYDVLRLDPSNKLTGPSRCIEL